MNGVRIKVWDDKGQRTYAEYMVSGDRAVLTSGKTIASVSVSPADAKLAKGLEARVYTPDDGKNFLNALLVTYKNGSRMAAQPF